MNIERLLYYLFMFTTVIASIFFGTIIYIEQINQLDYCIENGYEKPIRLDDNYFYCTKFVKLNDSISYKIEESGLIPYAEIHK